MDENEFRESDYLAGAVIRQMLNNIRNEGKRALKNDERIDYCDYVLVIYPDNNGKGGKWYCFGKDILGEDSAIQQGLLGYNYDFDIKKMDDLINKTENQLLKNKLKSIKTGNLSYDFVVGSLSYFKSEEFHRENRFELKKYMDEKYPDFREIL